MTLQALWHGIVLLSLPWLVLEVCAYVLEQQIRSANVRMPLFHLYTRFQQATTASNGGGTSITRGSLWIKVETCAFNAVPASVLARLGVKSNERSQRTRTDEDGTDNRRAITTWLNTLYDVGVLFAVGAFVASLAVIVWGAFILIGDIADLASATEKMARNEGESSTRARSTGSRLIRRAASLLQEPGLFNRSNDASRTAPTQASSWTPKLTPLIPGLTLPWSHLLPLTLALSITQVIHEAGHAVCGALHNLHALSMGVMLLFPAIPGAFVVLPEAASHAEVASVRNFDDDGDDDACEAGEEAQGDVQVHCCTQDRLRIISAGVWHNALTSIVLGLLLLLSVGRFTHNLLWRDAGGVRVFHVDRSSPLSQHLSPGMLVTHLDDVDLRVSSAVDPERRAALWDAYLSYLPLPDTKQVDSSGWYVSTSEWAELPSSCCDKYSGNTSDDSATRPDATDNMLCYISGDGLQGRCYDPTLLTNGRRAERCSSSRARTGKTERVCIFPDDREQLLRISTPSSGLADEQQSVILFQGNRYAVHAAIHASPYDFRFGRWLWPQRMFEWSALVVRYTLTLSVAMALFNMLPLPSLDGDVFLMMVLMSWATEGERETPQDQEAGRGNTAESHVLLNGRSDYDMHDTPDVSSQRRPTNGQWRSRRSDAERRASYKPLSSQRNGQRSVEGLLRFIKRPSWPAGRASGLGKPWRTQTVKQVHARVRWTTMALAVFVMGGSVVLHIVQAGEI